MLEVARFSETSPDLANPLYLLAVRAVLRDAGGRLISYLLISYLAERVIDLWPYPTGSRISSGASPSSGASFDLDQKTQRLGELEHAVAEGGVWADPERARRVVEELKALKVRAAELQVVVDDPGASQDAKATAARCCLHQSNRNCRSRHNSGTVMP